MGYVIAEAIRMFSNFLWAMFLVRVILSWTPISRSSIIFTIVNGVTEPFVKPIRLLIQRSPLGGPGMMLDFSVMIAFILIRIITPILMNFAIVIFG